MVVRGSGQFSVKGSHGGSKSDGAATELMVQISWSVFAFGWQDSQEKVPEVEARADMNWMRPERTSAGVGSLPTPKVASTTGLARSRTSTIETVLSTVFST